MKKNKHLLSLIFLITANLAIAQSNKSFDFDIEQLRIEYEKFTLDNGLTLIVHEDDKAPIVAVNVWYHVGSKNEPEGRTGFAHLFEHLMFTGSENYNDDYIQALESIGATDYNGTTSFDRTNYFQNVPKAALDVALWMESDRMGHFKNAISQEKLDQERGVVQNEKRQYENEPYGKVFELMIRTLFPANHPYSHSVIGSMEDLDAASVEDVKSWFTRYYGAANAVLVIAGDVNAEEVHEQVKQYFGDIPSGPPVSHMQSNVAKRTGEIREVHEDRVPQSRIYMVWNVPEWGSRDSYILDLIASTLAEGKNSRLYKRLVYDEQIATGVLVDYWKIEIAGFFSIEVDVKPGVENTMVEKAVREELAKLLNEEISEKELHRVKTNFFADFIRKIERIGGFGGKSDILAENEVYGGKPDYYMQELMTKRDATAEEIRNVANQWLSDGLYILEVNPFPEYQTIETSVDRSQLPEVGKAAEVNFPDLQKDQLDNGMNILLARRSTVPLVEFRMVFDAGYAADKGIKAGTANLTMKMLDEGTTSRNSLQINEELTMLGATLGSGSNLDQSYVAMSSLKNNFDQSLELFADVILNPSFPSNEFQRLQKQQIVAIQNEKTSPLSMAQRILPKFLYGEDHAYGNPLTGSGYVTTVNEMTVDDLKKYYNNWFKPNNATFIAVGNISMPELKNKLNKIFGKWQSGTIPPKNLTKLDAPNENKIYLMDRPESLQSLIFAGHLIAPYGEENELAVTMVNNILGGEFTSRLNMNLRVDKSWAYGALTFVYDSKGQRPFLAYAPVQTDKTAPSMTEISKEINAYVTDNPATEEEFKKTRKNAVLSLSGRWETMNAVEGSIKDLVRYNLRDNYYQTYAKRLQNLDLKEVRQTARKIIDPSRITWVVVGDRSKIEPALKDLNIGEVIPIDTDGNVLSPVSQKIESTE